LYRETVTQNGLDEIADASSLTLLENAARALDRLRQAEAVVRKEGATIKDRFEQLRPHPMVAGSTAKARPCGNVWPGS
jgi:phage terminase small subunit